MITSGKNETSKGAQVIDLEDMMNKLAMLNSMNIPCLRPKTCILG